MKVRKDVEILVKDGITRLFKGLVDEQSMDFEHESRGPGDKLPILQERCMGLSHEAQSHVRAWAENAIAAGEWQPPEGVSVDQFVGGLTVIPTGDVILYLREETEVVTVTEQVTFHGDVGYSRRLK